MMSRMQYQDLKGSSSFHNVVYGDIVGYKEGFIAQGFSWKEGIDYEETFGATRS